jgi:hypothetical protein
LYDPNLQKAIWIQLGAPGYVWHFNSATNSFVQKVSVPSNLRYVEVASAYDSNRKKHIVSGEKGMWFYDAVTDTWSQIANVPAGALGSGALAYDPQNQVLVTMNDSGALWTYNQTGQWTNLTTTGGPNINNDGARFGTLVYDSTHQVFIFLNLVTVGGEGTGGETETWAYRYKKASDPNPPAPPKNLRLE